MKVAIDGPAGSGKSTVAKLLAKKLGFKHIDTGAYYRWLTYHVLKNDCIGDKAQIIRLAQEISYNDIDESKIRTQEVTKNVSLVSAIKEVRKVIVRQQRIAAEKQDIVMEGRDIGTVVFPEAELKIFLTASVEERAKRRWLELKQKGQEISLEEVKKDIENRDKLDSEREHSPLKQADDAIELDTTGMAIDEVVEHIAQEVFKRKGKNKV